MSGNWYKPGDWWIYCDSCGKKIRASESKHRWDGLIVCADDWETRHPQDFVKAVPDKQSVPFSRPEPADTFIVGICTIPGQSSFASVGVAGCMIAGQTWGFNTGQELIDAMICTPTSRLPIADMGSADCATIGN